MPRDRPGGGAGRSQAGSVAGPPRCAAGEATGGGSASPSLPFQSGPIGTVDYLTTLILPCMNGWTRQK